VVSPRWCVWGRLLHRDDERRGGGDGYENFTMLSTTSEQARLPAEFKHIIKRRKRN